MQYTVNHLEKGKVEIKVDVPKEAFEKGYRKVLMEFGKDVNIAGFRSGKAPAEVVEQHVGLAKILNQTASQLITEHLWEIFQKEDLTPLDSPKMAIGSLAKDSPFTFTASFTQKPKVKLGDWKKIKVKRSKAQEIKESDVDKSIQNIFEAWVKRSKIKNPAFAKVFDSEAQTRGATADGQKSKVGEGEEEKQKAGRFIYDARGDKVFIRDDGSPSTDAQDKIDDNFARGIGARDLAHLRELVRKDLERLAISQVEAKFEEEILEELIKISEVEAPDILVEDELNRLVSRNNADLERSGTSLAEWLSIQGKTAEQFRDQIRRQAEKNVRIQLALSCVSEQEGIGVTEEEVDKQLKLIEGVGASKQQQESLRQLVAHAIVQTKTLSLLKEQKQ